MASTTHSSEIPDNHKESWLALLSAAEVYCQKSGCDLAILIACKKFRSPAGEEEGGKNREGSASFQRECDFSYNVWGQGFLAESARRYMDDIGVLHSTSMLTAHKHTRHTGEEGGTKLMVDLTSDPGHRGVSGLFALHASPSRSRSHAVFLSVSKTQNFTGDGGVGGVSPNARLYSQNYPSICNPDAAAAHGGGQNGNREKGRERSLLEAERGRQRAGIVDLEEEGEEAEEEDMDERQPYRIESAGEESEFKQIC